MKKIFTLTLAIIMTLSLAACGGNSTPPTSTPTTEPPSQSAAEPSSTAPVSTVTDSKYKPEVKLLDDKNAAVVIGGAVPTSEMVGTHWGVELDNKYAVRLDVEDGFFHCASWKLAADMSASRLSNINFTIADDALILYADLSSEADFSFADVKEVTLVIDDIADTKFRYDPVTLAMADVVVEEITVTAAKLEMPAPKGESSEESAEAPGIDTPAPSGNAGANTSPKPIGEYYNNSGEKMTITESNIEFVSAGKTYSTAYADAEIKVVDSMTTSIAFTADGSQIVMRYNPTHLVTTPGSMSLAVEADGKPVEGGSAYRVRAKASTSKMAGTYQGGWTTLTISADGSFTYVDTKLNETLSGVLPDGAKSGVTLTLGSYTVKFNFSEDFDSFSTDIKDASGMMVSGDDMSRG